LDEISQIRKKIPSADVVLAMSPRPPDGAHQINITSEEWQVLVLVDGHRTVEDIATSTGAEAYQTTRLLFGLLNAGLIEHKQVPAEDESEARSSRSRRHTTHEADSNVVELQPDADVSAYARGDERRQATSTPPAPPPAPGPPDEDRRAVQRGAKEPRRQEGGRRAEPSEREPEPSRRRFRGPRVDRAVVVRELAGLFSEGNKPPPRAVPSREEPKSKSPPQKRRVEDDDQVDGKLIGRMIDGVKEL
jgi:hypothetical protein